MNHKSLLGTAVAAALLFGAQAASACAITAWNGANTVLPADAGEPTTGNGGNPTLGGRTRYSGRCGLKITGNNKVVQDTTPAGETSYKVRFYVYTGDFTGTTDMFRATNAGGTTVFNLSYNGTSNVMSVGTNGTANVDTMTVLDNRWYSVELDWLQASGVTGKIRGAGAAPCVAPATSCTNNELISVAAPASALVVDTATLGIIAASGITVTTPPFVDEFDSRRTQSPGRLVRGDANASNSISTADITGVLLELNGDLRVGRPDCNENGLVTTGDITCLLNLIGVPD